MGAAAALATLEIVADEAFLANIRSVGAAILSRLSDSLSPHAQIFDVRGLGLMIGIEVVDSDGAPSPKLANKLAERAMEFGLVMRTSRYGHGNVVKIRPPLILQHDEAQILCDRVEELFMDELA